MPIELENSAGALLLESGGLLLLESDSIASRNDGVHLQYNGADVASLRAAGTLAGIVVAYVSARNGPGSGTLTLDSSGNLTWTAPGSSTPGTPQTVGDGGLFTLEDGADNSKYLIVFSYPDYLPTAAAAATVELGDLYNELGTTGPGDVTAAQATAGQTITTTYTLANLSPGPVNAVKLWLDNTASGFTELSVSSDGVNYFSPTSSSDTHVLTWSTIAAGGNVNVYVKRTAAAAATSNASILDVLQWQWLG